jgi:arylsulfatase A-like enzyme
VVINLEPGWIEDGPFFTGANSANRYDTHVPLIWYGWKIKRGQITRHVNLTDIAPTLSHFLDIPFPNGCTGTIITELD